MLECFRLAHFRFRLLPKEPLFLPSHNKGNTLRGAFGSVFKRLTCLDPSACHLACRLKSQCPYGQLFEPAPPEGAERLSKNADLPRPFVIRPPLERATRYDPDHPLSFDLVLIGKGIDFLPYFVVTFRELGNIGIGSAQGKFLLDEIIALDLSGHPAAVLYQERDGRVQNHSGPYFFKDLLFSSSPLSADRITLHFKTPTVLKADGRIVARPQFHEIIRRLRDRIHALAYFYCGETLPIDHKGLGERAEQVVCADSDFRWEERNRTSRKRNLSHEMSGFVGTGTYEGNLEEFWPLLVLGEHLHVGKYAVWGNGWYEIVSEERR